MNSFIRIAAVVLLLGAVGCVSPAGRSEQGGSVSLQIFYDELSPYGTWVNYQSYGYVWVPDVEPDFYPYATNGRWVYTEAGWTWYSSYSWGWAPFHYGRWAYDDMYGWLWVPATEWGPAWVTWRRSAGYYGWTPMAPGITVELSFSSGYRVPEDRWIFVRDRDIARPDIDRVYVDRSQNITIVNNSTVIVNTYVDNSRNTKYVAGPERGEVERVASTKLKPVSIREEDRPGQSVNGDELRIFRPRVGSGDVRGRRPAPSKAIELRELKPAPERRRGHQKKEKDAPDVGRNEMAAPILNPPSGGAEGRKPTPPDNSPPSRNNDNPPGGRSVPPSDRLGSPPQPPAVSPPEKKSEEHPRFRTDRPADPRRRSPESPAVKPPAPGKGSEQMKKLDSLRNAREKQRGAAPGKRGRGKKDDPAPRPKPWDQ